MGDQVLELYSVRDAARLFGLTESRLRYWIQAGFLRPSMRQGGRFYYTFGDLVGIKAAVELLGAGIPMVRVRRALDGLRGALPARVAPTSRLRVLSDGETLVVVDDGAAYEPHSGQLVMSFAVSSLSGQLARLGSVRDEPAHKVSQPRRPSIPPGTPPSRHGAPSPYQQFLAGCTAEESGDIEQAEKCYRRAIELEPSLAAAHTNLGNLAHRRGSHRRGPPRLPARARPRSGPARGPLQPGQPPRRGGRDRPGPGRAPRRLLAPPVSSPTPTTTWASSSTSSAASTAPAITWASTSRWMDRRSGRPAREISWP